MATKWLAFLLFFIQVEYLSCCVFDKVNELRIDPDPKFFEANKNECLAACYGDKECFAVMHNKKSNTCWLYSKGEQPKNDCGADSLECYILQRDEVDPMCKTFVNF